MTSKWTNAKAALIGHMLGQGHSTPAIAETIADGTSPQTIQYMRRCWGLLSDEARGGVVEVAFRLDNKRRSNLNDRAAKLGISPAEFTRRILTCALDDDLYQAVTDGRFE